MNNYRRESSSNYKQNHHQKRNSRHSAKSQFRPEEEQGRWYSNEGMQDSEQDWNEQDRQWQQRRGRLDGSRDNLNFQGNDKSYGESYNTYGSRGSQQGSQFGYGSPTTEYSSYDQGRITTRPDRSEESNSFLGKGPKGYKRADARIEEEVCDALTHDRQVDASDIEVKVKDGIVTLSGTVSERRMKRLAEDCAERIRGVTDVRNELTTSGMPSSFSNASSNEAKSTDNRSAVNNKSKNINSIM